MISLYNMLCCKSYLLVWLATVLLYQGGTADHPPVLISLRLNLGPRPDRSTSASDSFAILRRDEELLSEAA